MLLKPSDFFFRQRCAVKAPPVAFLIVSLFLASGCGSVFRGQRISNKQETSSNAKAASGTSVLPTKKTGDLLSLSTPDGCKVDSPLEMQRLTKLEYNNVVRDVFGVTGDFSKDFSAPAQGPAGFTTESAAQNLSKEIILDLFQASSTVAQAAIAQALKPQSPLTKDCGSNEQCVTDAITSLLTRSFRRPPLAEEVNRFVNLFKTAPKTAYLEKMQVVIQVILLSPQFLFRAADNSPENISKLGAGSVVLLTDYELASRLSFFIWGSVPDDALLKDASEGKLREPENLKKHAIRLLGDARSNYLSKNFSSQWLGLEKLDRLSLDSKRFPNWGNGVKQSMRQETEAFMDNMFKGNKSVLDIVNADYSFADKNLEPIYELAPRMNQPANTFYEFKLPKNRQGILGQAGLLAMNSGGDHTTPVVRGKWVLEKFLCSSPPPPPPDVPMLAAAANGDLKVESKIRERLAGHRAQGAACFACHASMDPIGLSFENFDSMGYFRSKYIDGTLVDASGKLPSGEVLVDMIDLANVLGKNEKFPQCFTSHLSSFATGRNMLSSESSCDVQSIAKAAIGEDKPISETISAIVTSNSFRFRKVTE